MKQKRYLFLLLALSLLLLSGCKQNNNTNPSEVTNDSITTQVTLIVTDNGNLLGVGTTTSELYSLSTKDITLLDTDNHEIDASDLATGMTLEITYDGSILETYPAIFSNVTTMKIIDDTTNLISLYYDVIADIYSEDTALNQDISLIALDLTECSNLIDSEKAALAYLISADYKKECILTSYVELVESGQIEEETLSFPDGILITIAVTKKGSKDFSFSIEKWRSGTGAIGYSSCTTKLKSGKWSYELNGAWIS